MKSGGSDGRKLIGDCQSSYDERSNNALAINYIPDNGDNSNMRGITPMDIHTENSYNATGSHVEVYLMEEDGKVNILIEYQRKAYAEGSMKCCFSQISAYTKME